MKPPALPAAPSWFPGHMSSFMKSLPALLARTDIILELRDARLPLTSVNPNFEQHVNKWRGNASSLPSDPLPASIQRRIIVLNKRDLVPTWGEKPFKSALKSVDPDIDVQFTSSQNRKTIKSLHKLILSYGELKSPRQETNVLVVGMPNVGKSSILNALRSFGITGPTKKALQTSAHPGKTRVLSTRLKLSDEPKVYAYDTPGVMVPFLGKGEFGAERGVKLALIAGIKEDMYDVKYLAEFLLYRLYKLDPSKPPYSVLLPDINSVDLNVDDFLDHLAIRLGMLLPGGERDHLRAATWFVDWWRIQGGRDTAALKMPEPDRAAGWGFDFDWTSHNDEIGDLNIEQKMQRRMREHIEQLETAQKSGAMLSVTQERKREKEEKLLEKRSKFSVRTLQ